MIRPVPKFNPKEPIESMLADIEMMDSDEEISSAEISVSLPDSDLYDSPEMPENFNSQTNHCSQLSMSLFPSQSQSQANIHEPSTSKYDPVDHNSDSTPIRQIPLKQVNKKRLRFSSPMKPTKSIERSFKMELLGDIENIKTQLFDLQKKLEFN
jgi:hypothetical protein